MIEATYLLLTHIPSYRTNDDGRAVDELWHKDLIEHLHTIRRFTLASPVSSEPPPPGTRTLPAGEDPNSVLYVNLPHPQSLASAILSLPSTLARLWNEVGRARIVHIGVIGWPISLGWFVAPMARLRGRVLVVVIESSDWRIPPEAWSQAGFRKRLRHTLTECMARWCVRMSDAAFFTQEQYRQSLLGRESARGHLLPASWIDEDVILEDAEAEKYWDERVATSHRPPTVAFVGRLIAQKGLPILLEAMKILNDQGVRVGIDIFGTGEMEEECIQACSSLNGTVSCQLRGAIPYGEGFFQALRPYRALLVPSLGEEQPRIVYDAFSQGLPVLGSDTHGLRACVVQEVTGLLVPVGDAEALATLIRRAVDHPNEMRQMGRNALKYARNYTHKEMHKRRCMILKQLIGETDNSPPTNLGVQ